MIHQPAGAGPDRRPRPELVEMRVIVAKEGSISVAEYEALPFAVRRLYFIRDVPAGVTRGHHAHRTLEQALFVVCGAVNVTLEGEYGTFDFHLANPRNLLLIPPMHWRVLSKFDTGAIIGVAASDVYREEDYIRDKSIFYRELATPGNSL